MRKPSRATAPIEPGDILPRLALTGPRGEVIDTAAPPMAGRVNFLVFAGKNTKATSALLATLTDHRDRIEDLGARSFLVVPAGPAAAPLAGTAGLPGLGGGPRATGIVGIPVAGAPAPARDIGELKAGAMRLMDNSGDGFALVGGANDAPTLLVVGANLHAIDRINGEAGSEAFENLLSRIERRARDPRLNTPAIHPPVLAVPDVFSAADNAHLMSVFHTRGQEFVEPGHSVDHWVVETDTQAFITERLRTRLFPEIQKAFNYPITRHERYRIARYEGERGGERMGHRDNVEPSVAHRRFAVTINLNAEDYEGAELRFPEFSDQLYKPASGTAIVFSCSLLHEVVDMRAGSRFAMLAFLFGDS
jgi:hypothetical protein